MSVLLDDPAHASDDVLDRLNLAKSIFSLAKTAPRDWTLRIGIYASWGEGKSTLLNLIADIAKKEGMHVARFNPSFSTDATALWSELFLAIVDAFDNGEDQSGFSTSIEKVRARLGASNKFATFFKAATPSHPVAGPLFRLAELGSDKIREQLGITKERVLDLVRTKSADKRLLVFIDDVDRVEPALVPPLLLKLRDLEIPLTAFIVAVDPTVVTEGLSARHPGWKDAPEFLEKILQFHYWLHPPDKAAIARLARLQIPQTKLDIPTDVVDDIADALPANPRKLKEFFRSLWQLAPIVQRHGPDEIEWSLLLLLELLRAEAPLVSWELLRSERFRKSAAASMFFEKTSGKHKDNVRSDLDQELDSAARNHSLSDLERERLLAIIRKIGDVSLTSEDRIGYWSQIREEPPWMTLKEARAISDAWTTTSEPGRLGKMVRKHADDVGVGKSQAARGLLAQVLALRQQCLSAASDSEVLDDLRSETAKAQMYLGLLATICDEFKAFADPEWGFEAEDFILIFNHFSSWAHFTNTDEYRDARRNESDLLLRTASRANAVAVEILRRLDFPNALPAGVVGPETRALKEKLIQALLPVVISDARARFERAEGIASLWGNPHTGVYSYVLLSPDSGLYTDEFIATLGAFADRAKKDFVIQKNLIELLRAIVSSFTTFAGGVESPEAKARLAKAATIVPIIWKGAIASPIQPRLLGSLKEGRDKLLALFQPFGLELPTPAWWTT